LWETVVYLRFPSHNVPRLTFLTECEYCDETYAVYSSFYCHITVGCPALQLQPIECEHCKKLFKHKDSLRGHYRRCKVKNAARLNESSSEQESDTALVLKCPYEGREGCKYKGASRMEVLKKHIKRIHPEQVPPTSSPVKKIKAEDITGRLKAPVRGLIARFNEPEDSEPVDDPRVSYDKQREEILARRPTFWTLNDDEEKMRIKLLEDAKMELAKATDDESRSALTKHVGHMSGDVLDAILHSSTLQNRWAERITDEVINNRILATINISEEDEDIVDLANWHTDEEEEEIELAEEYETEDEWPVIIHKQHRLPTPKKE
jgi:hypothetical protein